MSYLKILDFLTPVDDDFITEVVKNNTLCLGNEILIHTQKKAFPELQNIKIALFGVEEDRNAIENDGSGDNIDFIRKKLYKLYPGKWHHRIADLGTVQKGNTPEDTYFAVSEIVTFLLKKQIIPIILGGGQELTFANYHAYRSLEQTVNLTSIDRKFDLGLTDDELTSTTYLSKIIAKKPSYLFNFSNVGYQSYYNSQQEIMLIEKMFFDAYRLGEVKDLENIEPVLRDSDIVSIDISAIRQSDAPANNNASPNGFYGEEICAIARYAGISDKVSSFGIYEYNSKYDINDTTASLISQIIWHFIEGVNFRAKDYPFITKKDYQKYIVLMENDDSICFYKSHKTDRWWMEVNIISNTKHQKHALIPCTYNDYIAATHQVIPKRWYKALKKMS